MYACGIQLLQGIICPGVTSRHNCKFCDIVCIFLLLFWEMLRCVPPHTALTMCLWKGGVWLMRLSRGDTISLHVDALLCMWNYIMHSKHIGVTARLLVNFLDIACIFLLLYSDKCSAVFHFILPWVDLEQHLPKCGKYWDNLTTDFDKAEYIRTMSVQYNVTAVVV